MPSQRDKASSQSGDRHAPIRALVARIRKETGRPVPDVDPDGPGIRACVLMVARDHTMSPSPRHEQLAREALRKHAVSAVAVDASIAGTTQFAYRPATRPDDVLR